MTDERRLRTLEEHELVATYDSFNRGDAIRLGQTLVGLGLDRQFPVVIDIRNATSILFHASLPGATADNDAWVERKARSALRFEASTLLIAERQARSGYEASSIPGWLDPAMYTLAGGAVAVRTACAGVVAVATASGLKSDEDHDFVIAAIAADRKVSVSNLETA